PPFPYTTLFRSVHHHTATPAPLADSRRVLAGPAPDHLGDGTAADRPHPRGHPGRVDRTHHGRADPHHRPRQQTVAAGLGNRRRTRRRPGRRRRGVAAVGLRAHARHPHDYGHLGP